MIEEYKILRIKISFVILKNLPTHLLIFDQTFLLKTKPEVFHPINQNIHLEWLKHRQLIFRLWTSN